MSENVERAKKLIAENKYQEVKNGWVFLNAAERLEVMKFCLQKGIDYLISDQHFKEVPDDNVLVIGKIEEYKNEFSLTDYQARNIREGFRGGRYDMNESVKQIALLVRLEDYHHLVEKYPCLSAELLSKNYNIFKCDPRRTESRVQFLQETQGKEKLTNEEFLRDLTATNTRFNFKYQALLEQKLKESIDKADFKILASMVNETPDYAYDKFLEMALEMIYQVGNVKSKVQEKRDKMKCKTIRVEIGANVGTIPVPDIGDPDAEMEIGKRLFYEILEKGKSENKSKDKALRNKKSGSEEPGSKEPESEESGGKEPGHRTRRKPLFSPEEAPEFPDFPWVDLGEIMVASSKKKKEKGVRRTGRQVKGVGENLNVGAINRYIDEAKAMGNIFDGCLRFNGGMKLSGEDYTYFFAFHTEHYEILEPIGQPGNRTFIVSNDFFKPLSDGEVALDTLISENKAFRVNHKDQELDEKTTEKRMGKGLERRAKKYVYAPTRIKSLAYWIEEGEKSGSIDWTMSRLIEEMTTLVKREALPEASKYILSLFGEDRKYFVREDFDSFSEEAVRRLVRKIRAGKENLKESDGEKE